MMGIAGVLQWEMGNCQWRWLDGHGLSSYLQTAGFQHCWYGSLHADPCTHLNEFQKVSVSGLREKEILWEFCKAKPVLVYNHRATTCLQLHGYEASNQTYCFISSFVAQSIVPIHLHATLSHIMALNEES